MQEEDVCSMQNSLFSFFFFLPQYYWLLSTFFSSFYCLLPQFFFFSLMNDCAAEKLLLCQTLELPRFLGGFHGHGQKWSFMRLQL